MSRARGSSASWLRNLALAGVSVRATLAWLELGLLPKRAAWSPVRGACYPRRTIGFASRRRESAL